MRLIKGEFGATPELVEALVGQDIIYHFIWTTTPGSSWGHPMTEIEGNLRPTLEFLNCAEKAGVRKIIFPSSGGAVYGSVNGDVPQTEDMPTNPSTPYGVGKLAVEGFLRYFHESTGAACDIYRIGNAYGRGQPTRGSQGVVGIWLDRIRRGEPIEVFGGASPLRDYIYVEDIATLMTFSLRDTEASGLFNLGTGRGVSPLDLVAIVRRVIPRSFGMVMNERREFDGQSVILDGSRLLSQFPDFSITSLEDGIRATWQAMGPNES